MKTITEFAGATLKNALKTKQELITAGKTAEELPAAMGEALKLEGDKLNLMLNALEVVEKKTNDLKRVVVWSLQEGEKAPRGTEQKGEHYFGIEFFPPLPGQQRKHGRGEGRDGRDKKDRGKRRGKRGDKRRGRGESPDGARNAGAATDGGKPGPGEGDQKRRPRRKFRPQAPASASAEPLKPIQPIQPKPQSSGENSPPSST